MLRSIGSQAQQLSKSVMHCVFAVGLSAGAACNDNRLADHFRQLQNMSFGQRQQQAPVCTTAGQHRQSSAAGGAAAATTPAGPYLAMLDKWPRLVWCNKVLSSKFSISRSHFAGVPGLLDFIKSFGIPIVLTAAVHGKDWDPRQYILSQEAAHLQAQQGLGTRVDSSSSDSSTSCSDITCQLLGPFTGTLRRGDGKNKKCYVTQFQDGEQLRRYTAAGYRVVLEERVSTLGTVQCCDL